MNKISLFLWDENPKGAKVSITKCIIIGGKKRKGNFRKANRYRFSFREFRRTFTELKAGRSFRYDFRWLDYPSSHAFLHAAQLHTKHGFLQWDRGWRYIIKSLSLDRGPEGARPKRGIPLLFFARGHDGMRPRRRFSRISLSDQP